MKMNKPAFITCPKRKPYRDPNLLKMARDRSCLLKVPHVCSGRTDTVMAAHANWSEMGKGMSSKADDFFTVWGCSSCHSWLDQGSGASREERKDVWWNAYKLQLEMWQKMAKNDYFLESERKSAAKAILAFLVWRDEHSYFFDEGDWLLEYSHCVDCLEAVTNQVWDSYSRDCLECEKRMRESANNEQPHL